MMRRWRKLGQVYCPNTKGAHPKLISHAANPLPLLIEGDVYRIFYSGRDGNNCSSVGAVDIDIIKRKVVSEYTTPFFEHGPEDSFYSAGVSIGCCYSVDNVLYMLFMGWQNPPNQHWRGDIGRLIVKKDLSLVLESDKPFMGADACDPISLSYPWVSKRPAGGFDIWYGSTHTWDAGNGEMLHVINHAFSPDGSTLHRTGLALPYKIGEAQAFSKPTVVRSRTEGFDMWFSYRSGTGEKYRIGHAYSEDGNNWELNLRQSGIDVSSGGWDSEMISYPYVFDHRGERFLLYNGNGFGKTGFGLAVLDS